MSKSKKNTSKKKASTAKKKPAAKKTPAKVEVTIPSQEEVHDLVADTIDALRADKWNLTPEVKKGFFARVKSWFKVS